MRLIFFPVLHQDETELVTFSMEDKKHKVGGREEGSRERRRKQIKRKGRRWEV